MATHLSECKERYRQLVIRTNTDADGIVDMADVEREMADVDDWLDDDTAQWIDDQLKKQNEWFRAGIERN